MLDSHCVRVFEFSRVPERFMQSFKNNQVLNVTIKRGKPVAPAQKCARSAGIHVNLCGRKGPTEYSTELVLLGVQRQLKATPVAQLPPWPFLSFYVHCSKL